MEATHEIDGQSSQLDAPASKQGSIDTNNKMDYHKIGEDSPHVMLASDFHLVEEHQAMAGDAGQRDVYVNACPILCVCCEHLKYFDTRKKIY